MKFFFQKKIFFKKVGVFKKIEKKDLIQLDFNLLTNFSSFSRFLLKNGSLIKTRLLLSFILSKFNNFIYFNSNYIFTNYNLMGWVVDDILEKRLNSVYTFDLVTSLIKPPFVIKSIIIPKKLRKKTKKKYLIKIVYKNENKRLKNAYKQLFYYSNKFNDGKIGIRLYKAFMFSFLE